MTTALDLRIPGRVKAIIDRLGAAATLTRNAHTYNPATAKTTSVATNYSVKATPPAPHRRGFEPAGTSARATLQSLVAAYGLAVTPAPGDLLAFDDGTYVVESVVRIASGDAAAAWQLDVVGN